MWLYIAVFVALVFGYFLGHGMGYAKRGEDDRTRGIR
jgi:hypothetical protein